MPFGRERREERRSERRGEAATHYQMRQRLMSIGDDYWIEDPGGERLALVKKALVSPLRERFKVEVPDGADLEVHGNVVDHEYTFERDGTEVGKVSKKWFRPADTYGVEIAPGTDPVLVLAATVAIDSMAHPAR